MLLSTRIQLQVGLALAVVMASVTFLFYRHTINTIRDETLDALSAVVTDRANYESRPFVEAQRNTFALRDEYSRRLGEADPARVQAGFHHWFAAAADGVVRVRPALDDHKRLPSIYIRPQIQLTSEVQRNSMVAFDLLREWGPVLTQNYYSAYIDLPGISLIMFSPSVNWGKEADATTNNLDYPPVQNSSPAKNPARSNRWTEIYYDDKARIWMLSTITPVDRAGEWVGTASQDIAVDELIKRTVNDSAPGTYNMIFDDDGSLLAHPALMEKIRKSSGNLKIQALADPLLAGFAQEAAKVRSSVQVRESPDGDYYLGIARIGGPNWSFVTVYPKALLQSKAYAATQAIVGTALIALVASLLLLAWIIRRQVAAPLSELGRAATSIAGGNLDVTLGQRGHGELGLLNDSFAHMASRLRERDLALNQRAVQLEHEIGERIASEQRVLHMATHDALTGLANRGLLMDRLQQAIAGAERNQDFVAVLFIDLDHFKNINDTLGHDVGDEVLRRVSRAMSQLLRKSDTLCRFGGDEFVLLLPLIARQEDAALIAEKIITSLGDAVDLGDVKFNVTSSIGISIYPSDGPDGETLMRNADIAMYRAKTLGRNCYQCYTPDMGLRASEALRLEAAIGQAIRDHEFVLYYQPKVAAKGHRIVGAEALLRWNRPGHGLLSPGSFIAFAEERNLMAGIDQYVLQAACHQIATWQSDGVPLVPVAVNLSADQFARDGFPDEISAVLARNDIKAQWLQLEITEGVLLQEGSVVANNLAALRRLGIKISVDDFGTGYSSLSYLHRLPIDELKIDQSFVQNIEISADDSPLVRAIIGIARDLKLSLVAEGVETQRQADFLRQHGCDELQGYFFFRPMPHDQFRDLLQSQAFAEFRAPA